jgi:hypothetical protein
VGGCERTTWAECADGPRGFVGRSAARPDSHAGSGSVPDPRPKLYPTPLLPPPRAQGDVGKGKPMKYSRRVPRGWGQDTVFLMLPFTPDSGLGPRRAWGSSGIMPGHMEMGKMMRSWASSHGGECGTDQMQALLAACARVVAVSGWVCPKAFPPGLPPPRSGLQRHEQCGWDRAQERRHPPLPLPLMGAVALVNPFPGTCETFLTFL